MGINCIQEHAWVTKNSLPLVVVGCQSVAKGIQMVVVHCCYSLLFDPVWPVRDVTHMLSNILKYPCSQKTSAYSVPFFWNYPPPSLNVSPPLAIHDKKHILYWWLRMKDKNYLHRYRGSTNYLFFVEHGRPFQIMDYENYSAQLKSKQKIPEFKNNSEKSGTYKFALPWVTYYNYNDGTL